MRDWPSIDIRFPARADVDLPDLVTAALDAETVAAIEERSPCQWVVAFRDASARDAARVELEADFSADGLTVHAIEVSDEDWARRSQADLGPVRVGRFIVAPPWHSAGSDPDGRTATQPTIRLIIEPSMGFGSGHHATTRLCLQALQTLPVSGASVLDVGTGSGILAIAAAKLGAADVQGVDVDADALESAQAAAAMNGTPSSLTFRQGDFREVRVGPSHIVLANLTGSMLAASVETLLACVAPGGYLILSGITTAEAPMVLDAYQSLTTTVWRGDDSGWVGLLLRI